MQEPALCILNEGDTVMLGVGDTLLLCMDGYIVVHVLKLFSCAAVLNGHGKYSTHDGFMESTRGQPRLI
jgi:hypothetical protein